VSVSSDNLADLSRLRVLLVHEWLYTWAGGERDLEQMLELIPHADVLAGIVTPQMRRTNEIARRARESWVGHIPGSRRMHRWFLPLHAYAFRWFDTSQYDLIVSISHAFEKAVRPRRPDTVHLCYCLSPPRYLWDLSAEHEAYAAPIQRLALRSVRSVLRRVDLAAVRGVDHFVSQSHYVADRVRRCYGRESRVVYPPVSPKPTARVGTHAREPFLLTIGRLVPYKRVDLAIEAAHRLGMRLVVAGDGPERERLQRLAGPMVTFAGHVSESEAGQLLSSCAAFVFCADEDFGLTPIEANAHGAPVVAFARGGILETMQAGRTAIFFHEPTVDALVDAIERCLQSSWDIQLLRANAERFAPHHFRRGMHMEITRALARR
jgi:glycosyltransferase involved in cell wall biosynthesis